MRYVICKNDIPYRICPEGTSEQMAKEHAAILQQEDTSNDPSVNGGRLYLRVYYHVHHVSELALTDLRK
jgi:hypothetical protein